MAFIELSPDQLRQYIDSESVFSAHESARAAAGELRGSMFWRTEHGKDYLVRASTKAKQQRLGPRNSETQAIFDKFTTRKTLLETRRSSLVVAMQRNQRLNRALRVGRCPPVVVGILARLASLGLSDHFLTVGTHALYAYETAAGVRVEARVLATQDVDILFDTRKRLSFFTRLAQHDLSLIEVLKKVDKTFEVRPDQLQTAVNASGFEVDVIRRIAKDGDPHPLRMSPHEDDLWAVQVSSGEKMVSGQRFSQVVVATDGSMARMNTIAPQSFVRLKNRLAKSSSRDPLKRVRDNLQAQAVTELLDSQLLLPQSISA
jgi:hypothetical protein